MYHLGCWFSDIHSLQQTSSDQCSPTRALQGGWFLFFFFFFNKLSVSQLPNGKGMLCVATAMDRIQRHKIWPVPFSSIVVGKWVSPRDAHRHSPCSLATRVWVFWFLTLATRKQRFVTPGNWLYKNTDNNKGLHAQSWLVLAFWESSSVVVVVLLPPLL